jgi:hypothetical protein
MASGIQDLEWFARESLSRGLGKPEIRKAMLGAGWTEDQVRNALDAYADASFPVPIPKPRPQLSARDAFLYLVLFTTLYFSSYNLGSLIFDFINKALPDSTVLIYRTGWDSIRWSASSLIVAFPTFLFLSYYINKDVTRNRQAIVTNSTLADLSHAVCRVMRSHRRCDDTDLQHTGWRTH